MPQTSCSLNAQAKLLRSSNVDQRQKMFAEFLELTSALKTLSSITICSRTRMRMNVISKRAR